MEEEWIENIKKYSESKHFYDLRRIDRKLFREGNAVNLDPSITVPLRPMPIYMSYYKKGLFKKITFGEIFALEGKHDIFK